MSDMIHLVRTIYYYLKHESEQAGNKIYQCLTCGNSISLSEFLADESGGLCEDCLTGWQRSGSSFNAYVAGWLWDRVAGGLVLCRSLRTKGQRTLLKEERAILLEDWRGWQTYELPGLKAESIQVGQDVVLPEGAPSAFDDDDDGIPF